MESDQPFLSAKNDFQKVNSVRCVYFLIFVTLALTVGNAVLLFLIFWDSGDVFMKEELENAGSSALVVTCKDKLGKLCGITVEASYLFMLHLMAAEYYRYNSSSTGSQMISAGRNCYVNTSTLKGKQLSWNSRPYNPDCAAEGLHVDTGGLILVYNSIQFKAGRGHRPRDSINHNIKFKHCELKRNISFTVTDRQTFFTSFYFTALRLSKGEDIVPRVSDSSFIYSMKKTNFVGFYRLGT